MSLFQTEHPSDPAAAGKNESRVLSGKDWQALGARSLWLLSAILCMLLTFVHQASANTASGESLTAVHLDTLSEPFDDTQLIQRQQLQVEETGTGTLWLHDHQKLIPAPLLHSEADILISGIMAKVTFHQQFVNTSSSILEGRYVFPLPANAAVHALRIRINERTIHGMIHEKVQAENIYQTARKAGKTAGIIKQQRPNLFSVDLANIDAHATITVELDYRQTIQVENNDFALVLPLTFTPRYNSAQHSSDPVIDLPVTQLDKVSLGKLGTHTFNMNMLIVSDLELGKLESPSHAISYQMATEGYRISLSDIAYLDRDFELRWSWDVTDQPAVSVYTETVSEDVYMLGVVNPFSTNNINSAKSQDQSDAYLPRELVMIMDTSGSMGGAPIRTAKQAVQSALQDLKAGDYFNIVRFSDYSEQLFRQSQPVNSETLSKAYRFVKQFRADGGTQMIPALEFALTDRQIDGPALRQVVFITDGAVGYEKAVFKRIENQLGRSRLFTVGIGQAPNRYFMQQAAEAGRGTYTYIRDLADVGTSMSTLFDKLKRPVMTNVKLTWLGTHPDTAQDQLRDLHDGEPLVFSARLDSDTRGFELSGTLAGSQWHKRITFSSTDSAVTSAENIRPFDQSGVSTIWAREKITTLLEKQRQQEKQPNRTLIADEFDEYAMPGRVDLAANSIREQIIDIALDHQLVTPYTAFVAVDDITTRHEGEYSEKFSMANSVPAGSLQLLPLPQTATAMEFMSLISALCFLISLLAGICLFRLERRSMETTFLA